MKTHLNTLFVTTQGAYLHKKGDTVCVEVDGNTRLRVPLHNLESLVAFGRISFSPFLLGACAERSLGVHMLTERGRYLASVQGPVSGNVLLRRAQYRLADDERGSMGIAKPIVAAKILNCRSVVTRAVRDHGDRDGELGGVATNLARLAKKVMGCETLSQVRGIEGDAARQYFRVFGDLISLKDDDARADFEMRGRSRRPPLDRVNALLSFVYTLLMGDCRSALCAVGLDDQVGFLHLDRPGRSGLALDVMEEFRPVLADRLALSLINRRQLRSSDFEVQDTGAVFLTESGRRTVLEAWQKRKQDEAKHPFLGERASWGFFPHFQARLLARHVRGDLDAYPALLWDSACT